MAAIQQMTEEGYKVRIWLKNTKKQSIYLERR
jgi:hypothetical protein